MCLALISGISVLVSPGGVFFLCGDSKISGYCCQHLHHRFDFLVSNQNTDFPLGLQTEQTPLLLSSLAPILSPPYFPSYAYLVSFFLLLLRRGKRDNGGGDEEEEDLERERSAIARSKAGAKKASKAEAEYESDVSSLFYAGFLIQARLTGSVLDAPRLVIFRHVRAFLTEAFRELKAKEGWCCGPCCSTSFFNNSCNQSRG